jgi:2-oxoglutarate ferredoxin oxidoreductase subunit alpha
LLSDANLATGVQPFRKPDIDLLGFSLPVNLSPWEEGKRPFDWDKDTGISQRPIPGQTGGAYTVTGLAHGPNGRVAYDPEINQNSSECRSRKFAAFQKTLKKPEINGADSGDLLIVGWGSTLGAIEEAVGNAKEEGLQVSSIHLRFLFPTVPGLVEIFSKFKKVITVEINYSDTIGHPMITVENRRYAQLAWLLRAHTRFDVDCFSNVHGQPINPGRVLDMIKQEIRNLENPNSNLKK